LPIGRAEDERHLAVLQRIGDAEAEDAGDIDIEDGAVDRLHLDGFERARDPCIGSDHDAAGIPDECLGLEGQQKLILEDEDAAAAQHGGDARFKKAVRGGHRRVCRGRGVRSCR
jgi:hypothetical protein